MGHFFRPNPIPPYASGNYVRPEGQSTSGTGAAGAAGLVRLGLGYIRSTVRISELVVQITTAAASGNFQLSIYAADPTTGNPTGAPLFTSASQSTAATGAKAIACDLLLNPGFYYVGVQVDTNGATAVFVPCPNSNVGFLSMVGYRSNGNLLLTNFVCGLTKAGSFGTWPTLTGTGEQASDSLTATNANTCPAWGFKVA